MVGIIHRRIILIAARVIGFPGSPVSVGDWFATGPSELSLHCNIIQPNPQKALDPAVAAERSEYPILLRLIINRG